MKCEGFIARHPGTRTIPPQDAPILIQSLTASGEHELYLQEVKWATEESSLFSSLIKGWNTTSEPALENMVNLDD
ncbi:predicted protein [Botrytis cinerea T4]|uniref:Uncharacterized protein n=1 Tax=Botryotinia fuckeliana (strain T4) TaxID=999810 RepID=G2XP78_BOTF4|nr:predicted protein [Botrytis cinerea T4]